MSDRITIDDIRRAEKAIAGVGLVLCGGNVSFSDVAGWIERFAIRR